MNHDRLYHFQGHTQTTRGQPAAMFSHVFYPSAELCMKNDERIVIKNRCFYQVTFHVIFTAHAALQTGILSCFASKQQQQLECALNFLNRLKGKILKVRADLLSQRSANCWIIFTKTIMVITALD